MKPRTKLYRICRRSDRTGATGHGTGTFPKEQAEQIAQALNKSEGNRELGLLYWIELVKSRNRGRQ